MKKSLIALAVLAASGAAMAQSSVTVYGLVDVWVGSSKDSSTTAGTTTSTRNNVLQSGGFATSRIGFKGTEDLGGGLKANFNIETAISPDAPSATQLGSRNAWVGLSGGFGSVQLGRVWTPYDDARATANDTFNANFASSFLAWRGYQDRTTNGIRYDTPTIAGFTGNVAYAFGEDKTAAAGSKASSLTSFGLNYSNGPIVANLAHQIDKDNSTTTGGTPAADTGIYRDLSGLRDLTGAGIGASGKTTYTLINGSYDLGVAKLVAGYNTVKATAVGIAGSAKANEWNLGVEAPLGANLAVGAGYSKSQAKLNGVDNNKNTAYSLALKYNLSKRTFLYSAYFQNKNTSQVTPGNTEKDSSFAVGVQHAF